MLKFGIITEVDFDKGLARVRFSDEDDDFVSAWLKMGVMRAGADSFVFPFDVNEHVYCLMDEYLEDGVICGAVYDEGNKPKGAAKGVLRLNFGDNTVIEYNRISHTLSLDIKGDVAVKCEKLKAQCNEADVKAVTEISVSAPMTTITGALTVSGMVAVGGLASATPGTPIPTEAGTELNIEKVNVTTLNASNVDATGDVKAGNISLKLHKHVSASSGSPTGPATP